MTMNRTVFRQINFTTRAVETHRGGFTSDETREPVVPWWQAFSKEEDRKEHEKRVEKAKKARRVRDAKKARNARLTPEDRQHRHAKRSLRRDLKYMEEKLNALMPKDGMFRRIMKMDLGRMSTKTAAAQTLKWANEKMKKLESTAEAFEERMERLGEASTELYRFCHAALENAKQGLAALVLKARVAQTLPDTEPEEKWKIHTDKATNFSTDDPYLERSPGVSGAVELDQQAVSEYKLREEAKSLRHMTKEQREEYAEKEAKLLRFFTKAQKADYAELMAMRQQIESGVGLFESKRPTLSVPQSLKESGLLDTVTSSGPYAETREHLLSALGSFALDEDQWLNWIHYAGPQALVFLFTPSLATMIENDTALIPDILKKITRQVKSKAASLEIDVVCACVDGLSPPPEMLGHSVRRRTAEGFAFLHGPLLGTINESWNQAEHAAPASPSMQSSLTFRKQLSGPPEITLPLANTLFKTGRRSTLLASRWRYDLTKEDFISIKGPEERSNMSIQLLHDLETALPEVYIPAIPLTPARAIKNGLGNIVSKLDFGEQDAGPASRELERTVTEFLTEIRAGTSTVDVWALIIPSKSVSGAADGHQQLLLDASEVRKKWVSHPNAKMEFGYVGYWIGKGATFSRVLSGGGGWGAKQGLLSLDPQTTYAEIPEARFDFSGGSLEEQQASALGNLAQEGAYIQFFVAHNKRPLADIEDFDPAHMMRTSIVFGSVPSTVDDFYPARPPSSTQSAEKPIYHIRRGHFGFVSESGVFVRHSTGDSDISSGGGASSALESVTKIDLPYSYLVRDFTRSGRERQKYREVPGTVIRKVETFSVRKLPT
ncbi:V-type ATPase, C subunit family protein [Diplocarpon rosae]|nr:V-type ATPase, C subunit family protein [Diplocarpon rosae]